MDINWFPGHMAKALRNIKEHLPLVDVVVETSDARIPSSSRNPALAKILADKPTILVMNKADLADPEVTAAWVRQGKENKQIIIPCNSKLREGFRAVTDEAYSLVSEKLQRIADKGRDNRPLRLMVVGIPNTGKSTLINAMAARKSAQTSDRPGVTRGPQWVKSKDQKTEWLDMPGVLWPKLETNEEKLALAATGAIVDNVIPVEEVAFLLFKDLLHLYPQFLQARYKLTHMEAEPYDIYLEAAKRRGCILSGGRVDELRFAELFLNEFRSGILGRISLERPMSVEELLETGEEAAEDEDLIRGTY